jgi:glucosylceramidase
MKTGIFYVLITASAVFFSINTGCGNKEKASVTASVYVSSSGGDRLSKKDDITFTVSENDSVAAIVVDTTARLQRIEGFGASFNEAGMICLNSLPESRRDSVLRSLFDPETGSGFTVMKSPIAACDFSSAGPWYSYNDTPGDTLMMNFSIERDLGPNGLVTYIKSAARFGNFIIEAPMDFAPHWMIYGLEQGRKHVRPEYYRALARYYSKYISEYAKNGVTIGFLNPFNEAHNTWYSNEKYGKIGIMIKDHIMPQLRAEGLDTKIQLCDMTDRSEAIEKLPEILDEPEVMKHIHSVTVHGYDWDEFESLNKFHARYPHLPIWMTEVCYAPTNLNIPENGPKEAPVYEFEDGRFWGNMIMNDMKHHVSAWLYWNMILDQNGGPWLVSVEHGDPENNRQHPVVIINRETGKVTYTGLYYYLTHFSKFIRPGAHRVSSSGDSDGLNFAAFRNADGSVIIVIINNGAERKQKLEVNGSSSMVDLQAGSITTIRLAAAGI